jgi:hypothetical protein
MIVTLLGAVIFTRHMADILWYVAAACLVVALAYLILRA